MAEEPLPLHRHPLKLFRVTMAKRFRFKLPRVIPCSLQMCCSRNPTSLPEDPLYNTSHRHKLSPFNPKAVEISHPRGSPGPPPSTPEDSFVSVKVGRSLGHVRRESKGDSSLDEDSVEYSWRKDGRWHLVNKRVEWSAGSNDEDDDEEDVRPVIVGRYVKGKGNGNGNRSRNKSSDATSVFSSKYGNCETEALLSTSRRFKKGEIRDYYAARESSSVPAQRGIVMGEGKVRDSVAVVKRSDNPLEDFRTSMIEMVMERRMFEAKDLERLLRCFLSLNSREYHEVIVEAFSELWQMMFCDDDSTACMNKW